MLDLGKISIQLADMARQRQHDVWSYSKKEAAAMDALISTRKLQRFH